MTDLNNYRPTCILSVFAKLIETIVHNQISTFLRERVCFEEVSMRFL